VLRHPDDADGRGWFAITITFTHLEKAATVDYTEVVTTALANTENVSPELDQRRTNSNKAYFPMPAHEEDRMLKWKIAAVLGVAFGAAGVTWGYAQQGRAPGFYELRVYTALPGKRDALAERFASRTAAIYARHGITNVGYWIPQESDSDLGISAENTFIYIRGYPSKEERDKRLRARADDPEFTEVVRKAEGNPATKLIAKSHNIDMVPHGPYTAITLAK
jgi:hypothetical protein